MSKNKIDGTEKAFDAVGGAACTVTAVPDGEGRLRYLAETGVDKEHFIDLDTEEQDKALAWLRLNCVPGERPCGCSSYGMKHTLERRTGLYVTNNQFKEAMMRLGLFPVEVNELNWDFCLDGRSPIFKRQKDGEKGLPLPSDLVG